MWAISILAPPLKTSVAACHRRAPHLAAETYTSHKNKTKQKNPEQKACCFFFLFLGKKRENQKSPCAIFIWQEPKKGAQRIRFNASDPHRQISSTLSHGPKKNIKNTFACQNCQTPLLHSDIYKVEGGRVRGERHLHF